MSDEEHPSDPSDFDADALAALARPSGAPPAMDDDDGDEGMLDLRALAASAPPPAPPEDEPEAASSDTEATPSAEPERAAPAAVAPVARPAEAKKGGGGLVIGVGIGLAAAAAVFFFMRGQGAEEPVATAGGAPTSTQTQPASPPTASGAASPQAAAGQEEANAPEANAPEANAPEANPQPSDGEPAAEAAPSRDDAPAARTGRHGGRRVNRPDRGATNDSDGPDEPEHAAATVPATGMSTMHAEAAEPGEDRSMDALLNSALGGEPSRDGTMTQAAAAMAAAPPAANLPESPSRSVVTRVLGGLMGQMRRCAGDQVGMANARIRISNDGTVASVSIAGSPFGGTPQGSCMEGVVRRAHFPRFRRPTIDLTFPFSIRPLN